MNEFAQRMAERGLSETLDTGATTILLAVVSSLFYRYVQGSPNARLRAAIPRSKWLQLLAVLIFTLTCLVARQMLQTKISGSP
jgi:hypothetical protein